MLILLLGKEKKKSKMWARIKKAVCGYKKKEKQGYQNAMQFVIGLPLHRNVLFYWIVLVFHDF